KEAVLPPPSDCVRHPVRPTSVGQAADRDLLLGCIFCGGVLDHGPDDVVVGIVPVGSDLPVLAVQGLDAASAGALMIGAGDLDRLELVLEAKLGEALGTEIEIFQAYTNLLAGQRFLAELLLRGANALHTEHRIDQAADIKDLPGL